MIKCDKCGKEASLIKTMDDKDAWVCHDCKHFIAYKPEVYSRVVGYMRPVSQWNKGKQQEFKDRTLFKKYNQPDDLPDDIPDIPDRPWEPEEPDDEDK
jgi:DNA-directed RNA polymerase subunit RPC12/RpoP